MESASSSRDQDPCYGKRALTEDNSRETVAGLAEMVKEPPIELHELLRMFLLFDSDTREKYYGRTAIGEEVSSTEALSHFLCNWEASAEEKTLEEQGNAFISDSLKVDKKPGAACRSCAALRELKKEEKVVLQAENRKEVSKDDDIVHEE